jgi:hypothetical protein
MVQNRMKSSVSGASRSRSWADLNWSEMEFKTGTFLKNRAERHRSRAQLEDEERKILQPNE